MSRSFLNFDVYSYQPVGHLRHQEPSGKEPAEPGAGGRPGASRPGRLLRSQGAWLPGGGERWKLAAENREERPVNNCRGTDVLS